MHFKVALFVVSAILMSGCGSFFKTAKPKAKEVVKNPNGVEVVEEVDANSNKNKVVEASAVTTESYEQQTKKKTQPKKVVLKPEPFSIESDEEDPELLGPQSTIKDKIKQKEQEAVELKEETSSTTTKEIDSKKEEVAKKVETKANEIEKKTM